MIPDLTNLLPLFVAIPSRPFLMGTATGDLSSLARRYGGTRESYREESPQHTLTLPAFQIARTPVTNALYAVFVDRTAARAPLPWKQTQPPAALRALPVVDVSWQEARTFCSWLNGELADVFAAHQPPFRLPTEAEWEHAARGGDGRTFPWGDDFDERLAHTRESSHGLVAVDRAAPAGASPYGVLAMAGTVWEWTSSLDAPYPYDATDGREDGDTAGRHILRGGCYANPQGYARCACRFRLPPAVRNEFLGFRLARSEKPL